MQINVSNNPAADLATHVREYITEHQDSDILCFTAGGSALALFDYLDLDADQKRRTIFCMGDERVSGERSINNFLQLTERLTEAQSDLQIIDTCGATETPEILATRIDQKISEIISGSKNIKIICILGIGEDGHTAGIFPMDTETFLHTYTEDATYVPVTGRGLTIDSRASLTPSFILNQADQVLGFAQSKTKCAHIVIELIKRNYELNEMPAQLIKRHKDSYLFTDCKQLYDS